MNPKLAPAGVPPMPTASTSRRQRIRSANVQTLLAIILDRCILAKCVLLILENKFNTCWNAALVGAMFLIARIVDAFTDTAMGRIADKVKAGKGGKFKPWLVRMCGPVALASFLMYQTAVVNTEMWVRVVYMFVTYLLWGSVCYTAINIPY